MSSVKNAVIAAAGLGSRLGLGMPKCMIPINRVPILGRAIGLLSAHVETIVVVAGYREEMVVEYCQQRYRNVVIARNPEFEVTNTAQSLSRGARLVRGKTIFLDGDLILEERSLKQFMDRASSSDILIGVTRSRTEHAVYAVCEDAGDGSFVMQGFSRDVPAVNEWANIFVGPHDVMDGAQRFVFERLAEFLPGTACYIEVEEVDTAEDLRRAEAVVNEWEA